MHEWALAEGVISTVSEIAEKEGLEEVVEVEVKVGELQQIEPNTLEFALSQLKTLKLEKTKFNIRAVKAEIKCRVCKHKWFFQREKMNEETAEAIHFVPEIAHSYVRCPKCGSPDFEIVEGRGIWIESIKGVKSDV